jgi:capsular exopolysaccharide synthesis family protein
VTAVAISQLDDRSNVGGVKINPTRVLERVLRFWWIILITLLMGLTGAYLVNRYTTRIYPISASIIIRENDENVGAKFLYNNSLVNPYRNFYNEFFIMRSIPLLQQVVEDLRLDVSYHVEGEVKRTEYYMPEFPLRIRSVDGQSLPYGKNFVFTVVSEREFKIKYEDRSKDVAEREDTFLFNDTIQVNGSRLYFGKIGDLTPRWTGKELIVQFNHPSALAQHYSQNLKLDWAQPGAAVINLSLVGSVPQKEMDFMGKFIEYYQRYDVEKKQTIATKSIEFLDRQINAISDSLRYYEDIIQKAKLGLDSDREREITHLMSAGESIKDQELQMLLRGRYFDYLETYMNSESDLDQVILPSMLGISDPVLGGIVAKLTDLQFELRILKDNASDSSNPLVKESIVRIAQYKRDISEGIRSSRQIMNINNNLYKEKLRELEQSLQKRPMVDQSLANVQRNYKLNESLYSFIIQKRAEAGISRASTTSDIIVVNNPKSGGAITPMPMTNYSYGFAAGLLIPLLIFVLMEFLNNKVQSKEDIEQISTVPVIGTIGHNTTGTNLATYDKPKSYLAESFRALRSNLNYFTKGKDKKVILVTSSISGEGKTFTSINLATIIAFSGKKVALIGGDMRKPEISKDFQLSNRKGLSLYLSNMATLEEVIQTTQVENLSFIAPGPSPPNPAELYLGPKIEELFTSLLVSHDYVIIDSPPIGLVSDALSLLPLVDHVLLVARQGYTPLTAINQMQFMVDQGKLEHASILLNDITKLGMGYGYKYGYAFDYGYGYRYGHNRYYGKADKNSSGDDAYYQ